MFNDAEFRQTLRDSLNDKREKLALSKRIIAKYKELLEADLRKSFEEFHIDMEYFEVIWGAHWYYFSMTPLRKARDLADWVANLDTALKMAEAQVEKKEFKRGRFSEVEREQANSYPVEDLINSKTRKSGNKIMACCPFHQEDTPSFVIYADNSWHCFGCQKHGSGAIGFVMERDKCDFKSAVRNLLN